jgi:hypothetical protein
MQRRSFPTSREEIEERGSSQKWIPLDNRAEFSLCQELCDFIKAARLIVDLDSDLADHAPMFISNPRQHIPFTPFDIDFQ